MHRVDPAIDKILVLLLAHYNLPPVIPLVLESRAPAPNGSIVLIILLAVNFRVGLMFIEVIKVVVQVSALDVVPCLIVASEVI